MAKSVIIAIRSDMPVPVSMETNIIDIHSQLKLAIKVAVLLFESLLLWFEVTTLPASGAVRRVRVNILC